MSDIAIHVENLSKRYRTRLRRVYGQLRSVVFSLEECAFGMDRYFVKLAWILKLDTWLSRNGWMNLRENVSSIQP